MALFPLTQFDFPNVSNYDSDLREIIAMCKTLVNDYNTLVDGLNELSDGYSELKADFDKLEKLVTEFEKEIDEKVAAAVAAFKHDVDAEIKALKDYVDENVAIIRELTNDIISRLNDLLQNAYDYTDLQVEIAVQKFNVELAEVNRRIDELIFELPDAYNITKGYETDLIELIYDIYDATRDHAYTARQFDTAGKTATELDALDKTAYEFDTNGYDILYVVGLVINPYTGEYDDINEVLSEIAQAAAGDYAINATEYDALEIDATTFEAYLMTAYIYDFYAKQILIA